jgi:hypothetical protein
MTRKKHDATTESDIVEALARDTFYGQIPTQVVVPAGYRGADQVNGIPVETSKATKRPYIVSAAGGRLGFDGKEIGQKG